VLIELCLCGASLVLGMDLPGVEGNPIPDPLCQLAHHTLTAGFAPDGLKAAWLTREETPMSIKFTSWFGDLLAVLLFGSTDSPDADGQPFPEPPR